MERREIVGLWNSSTVEVLVTLVRAEGSSYRRPGARLLTSSSGVYAGTISGGCLEAEVVRKAPWLIRNGAVLERYAMAFEDTAEIPFGLGCGGTVDLLFESPSAPEGQALFAALTASLSGRESTVVSFLPGSGRALRRLVLDAAGEVSFASPTLSAEKIACARKLEPGQWYDGRFLERLLPPQRLFILGAGDDAKPLVSMASQLGWSVIVADGRAQLARLERFPQAERVTVLAHTGSPAKQLGITPADAVVLMTHSYEQDRDLLRHTLGLVPRYLGMLGSRHRSSLLLSEAAAILDLTLDTCCERVFAPVGLDLGGDGPEAIALAIAGEIQAVCHGRIGAARRLTPADVMLQLERGGSSRYLQAQCALDAG